MAKLLWFIGATVGGWVGWWLGEQFGGVFTAFIVSMVGTGAGIYWAHRYTADHF